MRDGSRTQKRKWVGACVLASALVACGGDDVTDLTGSPPPPVNDGGAIPDVMPGDEAQVMADIAKQKFQSLFPDLNSACGNTCHQAGSGGAPAWIGKPDAYKAIKAYPGIVVKDVPTSKILNKPNHEGRALAEPLRSTVIDWLNAEANTLASQALPSTAPQSIVSGPNTFDISGAGMNVPGAKLTFTASISGSSNDILTLSNIHVVAPAATGLHVVFPIFVIVPTVGPETEDYSFSNADQTVAAGQSATLYPGTLITTGWQAADKIRIAFTKLESVAVSIGDGGMTVGPTPCKSVSSFTMNAVPAIMMNGCLNCHNTGGPGNGSLDLSALAAMPEDDTTACAQARLRTNPSNPPQSDIILAPTGGVAAHPFKGASMNYATMMQAWIANEK